MRKVLALVAHDSKKDDMVQLVKAHKEELAGVDLIATRSTGQCLEKEPGFPLRSTEWTLWR